MPAIQVTLTTGSTAYSLLTLLRAVDSTLPGECRTLLIEADRTNAADSLISVGDSSIGASRYGYQLGPGQGREYNKQGRAIDPGVRIAPIYVLASTGGLKLNVEVTL